MMHSQIQGLPFMLGTLKRLTLEGRHSGIDLPAA